MLMLSHVARQPILNRKQKTIAYELLFRDGTCNAFPDVNPDMATSKILFDNLVSMDFEKLADGNLVFINFTQSLLEQHIPSVMSAKRCVVEILEDCEPTPKLLDAIQLLKKKKYKIALDDFIYNSAWEPFFPYIDIIKVDICKTPIDTVKGEMVKIREKYNIIFLAERVETQQEFNDALQANFSLFQGYFFAKPEIMQQTKIEPSKLTILRLLENINRNDFDFAKLEKIIATDPIISYKFLRCVNSTFTVRQTISSLKQALVYLGEEMVKRFATVVVTSDATGSKPSILFLLSLQRAFFLESCAGEYNLKADRDISFLTGLFSLMDVLLDLDLKQILHHVSLDDEVERALIQHEGELATLISIMEKLEQAKWDDLTQIVEGSPYNAEDLFQFYNDSFHKAKAYDI